MSAYRDALTILRQSKAPNNNAIPVRQQVRPLGAYSDFICDHLGKQNEITREGYQSPDNLFERAETFIHELPERLFHDFLRDDNVEARRGAILDLVWMIRSLDIAYNDRTEWKTKRNASLLFQRTKVLSDKEGRHPNLSWSDISLYHPVDDPRTFLPPGENRDQEILLYRTQSGIDRIFKSITMGDYNDLSQDSLHTMVEDLEATVDAVVYLNRVRNIGQFYQLDPYLGANNEYTGHGTGAFSAWSYTAGYFLAGNEAFKDRLLNDENLRAFDRDVAPYIEQIREGEFKPLVELIEESSMDQRQKAQALEFADTASKNFALFLRAHKGAIKRHAPATFDFPAPADLSINNRTAINKAIEDMHDGKPVH